MVNSSGSQSWHSNPWEANGRSCSNKEDSEVRARLVW